MKKIYKISGGGTYTTESGFKNAIENLHKEGSIPSEYEIYELTTTGDVKTLLDDIISEREADKREHKINIALGEVDKYFLNFDKVQAIYTNLSKLNFNNIYYPNGEIIYNDYFYQRHIEFIRMDLDNLGYNKGRIRKYITNNFIRLLEYTMIPDYNNLDKINLVYLDIEPNQLAIELCEILFKLAPNFRLNSSGYSYGSFNIFQQNVFKKVIRCINEFKDKQS